MSRHTYVLLALSIFKSLSLLRDHQTSSHPIFHTTLVIFVVSHIDLDSTVVMCIHTVLELTIMLYHFLIILMLLWVITCSFTVSSTRLPTWVLCTVSNAHLKSVAGLLIHSPPCFGPQNSGVPAL